MSDAPRASVSSRPRRWARCVPVSTRYGMGAAQARHIMSAAPSPVQSAKLAGLRYVTDDRHGLTRVRRGDHFRYVDADGAPVQDEDTLARIQSLAIPPA